MNCVGAKNRKSWKDTKNRALELYQQQGKGKKSTYFWTSAGCVVVEGLTPEKIRRIYLVVPSDPLYGKLVLPKGRVQDTESNREAAIREVGEEAGLNVRIFPDGYLGLYTGTMSRTHFYLAHPVESARPPKTDGEMSELVLLPLKEALIELTKARNTRDVDVLLKAALRIREIRQQMKTNPDLFDIKT
jgi:8-oxo-dGTP pyrophosphatase MutT (NUDIX family)